MCWLSKDPCHDYEDQAHTGMFKGVYRHGFETSVFRPDGSKCEYWLSGKLDRIRAAFKKRQPYLLAIAKIEVEQQGRARRARLNYLRKRKGKEATTVRE